MATYRERTRISAGLGLFVCGMSIIIAATVLNIAYDRLSGQGLAAIAPFLATLYDGSGKAGMTSILVAAGLSIIILSFVVQRNRRTSWERNGLANPLPGLADFDIPPADTSTQEVSPTGSVILQTKKYLASSR